MLAGGYSDKVAPLNNEKAMLRVAGRRVFEYQLHNVLSTFGRAVLVTNRPVETRDGVVNIVQKRQGIEGAVLAGLEHVGDHTHVLVVFSDIITAGNPYPMLVERAIASNADGSILVAPLGSSETYSTVAMDEVGKAVSIGAGASTMVFLGAALLPITAAQRVEEERFMSIIGGMASSGRLAAAIYPDDWVEVEYPWDLLSAAEMVLGRMDGAVVDRRAAISPTAVIEGPVYVGPNATIDHYAVVKGPAYIGEGAFVGAHAFVRNYADLERGAFIAGAVEVTHSLIDEGATVGRGSYVSYSVVGEGAVLEPGTVTKSMPAERRERLRPIYVGRRRVYKLGAIIGPSYRVPAGTVLSPGATLR